MAARVLRDIYYKLLCGLLALALVLPSAAAAQSGQGVHLLCAQTGQMSPEAAKAMAEIQALLGLDGEDEPQGEQPCDHCVLIIALSSSQSIDAPAFKIGRISYAPNTALGFTYGSQGPPLGSRAPPISA